MPLITHKLTEIPELNLNAEYAGLDENEKEEYLIERFAELQQLLKPT